MINFKNTKFQYCAAQCYFIFIVFLLLCVQVVGQAQNRILIDGIFEDWNELPVTYTDAKGDGGFSGVDFGQLQVYNDAEYIFFLLDAGTEINLQDLNDVTIYVDTDDDTNTGFSINGIGAELAYTFGKRSGFYYGADNSFEVFHNDINLVTAPTVTSTHFEISIKRAITLSGVRVFQNDAIKIVFKDNITNGDLLPASNEVLEYTFSSNSVASLPDYSIQKLHPSDLRIVSYNVLFNGIFEQDRIPAFKRVFEAIQPDIIGFQEIYDFTAEQVANKMETFLPSTNGKQWYYAKEGPDCHAISRYPILQSALIPGYDQDAGNGAFLIDVSDIEKEILLIVAHPPCCAKNVERQIEVDLIMQFLREAKNGNGPIPIKTNTPIIIAGDMNLVGDHRQLETFLYGDIYDEAAYGPDFNPDWDGSNFLDSNPYTTGAPFAYTWYNEGSSFGPGKLDYIIYSGSSLMLQNSYALFTPLLPQDSITGFNFLKDDVVVASDHLPIVVDFQFKNLTTQNELSSNLNSGILKIYPNPSLGMMAISFSLHQADFIDLQLINQNGQAITISPQKKFTFGTHQFQFDTSAIPSGLYCLQLITSTFIDSEKIIIHKY